jgi:Glu-tRNA(Gln) amidotransferase subunit E-like FAD-binding protein
MSSRRKHSKIIELPVEQKAVVDTLLAANRTYEQIAGELQHRGFEISRSSVGRYAQDVAEAARELAVITEQLRPILEKVADNPNLELGSVAAQMGLMQIIRAMRSNENFLDEKSASALLQAAAALQRAQVAQERLRMQHREKIDRAHKDLEKMAKRDGLSAETIEKIKGIYGLE